MNKRLAAARESVVAGALDLADDLDDEVVAQRAGEVAASDEVLVGLCRLEDRLKEIEAGHGVDDAADPVESSIIAAGIKLEDSVLHRIEQLSTEVVDDLRAELLQGGLEA
jgi:hypothetical protein